MTDVLIRCTAMDGKVRAIAAHTTVLTEELRRRHDTWPTATAALGRAATAGAMMGAMLKGEEKLTIQIKGGGPMGQIVVDANARGEVRAYADEPHVDLPSNAKGKLDVAGAVGTDGFLNVTKDLGLKAPYRGNVPLVSGELAEDFTYYFAKSEQTPSAVALGVLVETDLSVKTAGGFIIQLLPGLDDNDITHIETHLSTLAPITELLNRNWHLERILQEILPGVQVLERMAVHFHCSCSKERVDRTLLSLGKEEMEQILQGEGKAEIVCHFCNEKYNYNDSELRQLVDQLST